MKIKCFPNDSSILTDRKKINKGSEKKWNNVPFITWSCGEQTKIKHKVLEYYLPQWLKILSSWNKKINYIDGFGGIGAYHSNEDIVAKKYTTKHYGSPISSIKSIVDLKKQKKLDIANVLIIDEKGRNLDNIKKIIKYEMIDIREINIDFITGDFDKNINILLDKVENLAPTFFLIDPFGYSQIKSKTLKRIMQHKHSEILLTFMYNAIQRWLDYPCLESHFTDLFGSNEWKNYIDERTIEKEQALVNLFRFHCKEFSNFVYPYRLSFPDKNMPFYYLFHLCNHRRGCILMKNSFAKFNSGDLEYKGKTHGQLSLNLFADDEKRDWEEYFLVNFLNFEIPYGELLNLIIDLVPNTEGEIRKVLQSFECEGKIKIDAKARKRRCGIIESDIIIFPKK